MQIIIWPLGKVLLKRKGWHFILVAFRNLHFTAIPLENGGRSNNSPQASTPTCCLRVKILRLSPPAAQRHQIKTKAICHGQVNFSLGQHEDLRALTAVYTSFKVKSLTQISETSAPYFSSSHLNWLLLSSELMHNSIALTYCEMWVIGVNSVSPSRSSSSAKLLVLMKGPVFTSKNVGLFFTARKHADHS